MASTMSLVGIESAVSCASVDWEAFLQPLQARQYFSAVPRRGTRGILQNTDMNSDDRGKQTAGTIPSPHNSALDWILAVLSDLIGEVDPEDPLAAAGLDSLSAVEFRRKLSSDSGIPLPQTLAFDYPTAREVAAYVGTCQGQAREAMAAQYVELSKPRDISVQGKACRFPGNEPKSLAGDDAWHIFLGQVDAITEVPLQRFDINECFDADMAGAGFITYARHASILEGTHLFDHRLFGISSNEASAIDPQQRKNLEVAYAACHHAGRSRKSLSKASIGVFVGQCANDWAKTSRDRKASTFMGPGTHVAGHASFFSVAFCSFEGKEGTAQLCIHTQRQAV